MRLPEQFMTHVAEYAEKQFRGNRDRWKCPFAFFNYLGFWVLFHRLPRDSNPHYSLRSCHFSHGVVDGLEKAGYIIWGRKGGVVIFHNPICRDRPLTEKEAKGLVSIPFLGSDEVEAKRIAESVAAQVLERNKGNPKKGR